MCRLRITVQLSFGTKAVHLGDSCMQTRACLRRFALLFAFTIVSGTFKSLWGLVYSKLRVTFMFTSSYIFLN